MGLVIPKSSEISCEIISTDTYNMQQFNLIKSEYPEERSQSKAPTFALT